MKKYILSLFVLIGITSFICIEPSTVKHTNAWKVQVYVNGKLITPNSVIKPKEIKTYKVDILDLTTNTTKHANGRFNLELVVMGGKRPLCQENIVEYNSLTDTTIVNFLKKCPYTEGQQFWMNVIDKTQKGSFNYIVYLDKVVKR